jgi:hypothetical protein
MMTTSTTTSNQTKRRGKAMKIPMSEDAIAILRARAEFDQCQVELRREAEEAWSDPAVRDEISRSIERLCYSDSAVGQMIGLLARETWIEIGLRQRERVLGLVGDVEGEDPPPRGRG